MTRRAEKMISLRDDVFLTVGRFRGSKVVHIRQYDQADNGKLFPTKRGVCLTPGRFAALVEQFGDIDLMYQFVCDNISEAVDEWRTIHLGGGIYVTAATGFDLINIRNFFKVLLNCALIIFNLDHRGRVCVLSNEMRLFRILT